MKKLVKWAIKIGVTLVLLFVIAAFTLPMIIDPNDYKDTIENKVKNIIGRQVHLNGTIEWTVFPWLALTFNDVKIENEEGFNGESLAKINKLSAAVKIIPLLSKTLEIGRIEVDDAQFTLQVNKKGNSNWQSILTHIQTASNEEQESSSQGSNKVSVEGIDLKNIAVNYTDLQSKTAAIIEQLELKTGKITESNPLDLNASMHLKTPDTGLDVGITAEIVVNKLMTGSKIVAEIMDLTINGKMNAESSLPLTVSLKKKGIVDLAKDSLSLPEVLIKLDNAEITSNLHGKNLFKSNMLLTGDYQLGSFDMNEFLKKLTGAYFVTDDSFSGFSSSGSWSMVGNKFNLKQFNVMFSETKLTGSAEIKNLDNMSGTFSMHMNKFNIDAFMGDEETAGNSSDTNEVEIDFGHLKGNLTIGQLLVSGTQVENLNILVNTNGSKMVLSPIKADFYKGLLVTAIKVDTKAKSNKVIIEHNMDKIHAGPLLTDLSGSQLLTGIGDLDADLKIDKPFSDIPLKTAHGSIHYTLTDGAIYGVNVFGIIQKGLSLLYPEITEEIEKGEKKTSFALMQIDADINQGVLTTNTLRIESPFIEVGGDIEIDLVNMTIVGTIEPMLLDIPEQLVSEKYKKLLNLPIPVSLSGSLLEPKVSIDVKKLILATQKQRIDDEKEKLKGKLLDSLFGKKKAKEDNSSLD